MQETSATRRFGMDGNIDPWWQYSNAGRCDRGCQRRTSFGEAAKVTLGSSSLATTFEKVRPLEAVPPLPKIAPITESARAGARTGGVRIRGGTIAGLYPNDGAATLTESTVLRFTPVPDDSRYSVEVETDSGTMLFQAQTQAEARDGFRAALARAPGDAGLRQALETLERQLASEGER
jgi:hypothetical protein